MTNVSTIIAGPAKPDLRIHIGAVHVNLAAMGVHDIANFANRRLKNSMSGGICHHQRGKIARVFICLCAQIGKVDISIF